MWTIFSALALLVAAAVTAEQNWPAAAAFVVVAAVLLRQALLESRLKALSQIQTRTIARVCGFEAAHAEEPTRRH